MNTYIEYTGMCPGNRDAILDFLRKKQYKRVIDIGTSACSWASEFTTHFFDINQPEFFSNNKLSKHVGFFGNMCVEDDWQQILEDVEQNGKFDFAVCTHTLEDISNPILVTKMLSRISKKGFNAVPSKYSELHRHEGHYRGWFHHRWIFNKEGTNVVTYPKLNFIEYMNELDQLLINIPINWRNNPLAELQWCWKDECVINIINNDYIGNHSILHETYLKLLNA